MHAVQFGAATYCYTAMLLQQALVALAFKVFPQRFHVDSVLFAVLVKGDLFELPLGLGRQVEHRAGGGVGNRLAARSSRPRWRSSRFG